MNEKIIYERFELLYREIYFARHEMILLNKIIENYNSESKYKELICVIYEALHTSIFIKMAKIYEIDSTNRTITIFYMLKAIQSNKDINHNDKKIIDYVEKELDKINNNEFVNKLKTIRDKYEAHLDKSHSKGIRSISQKDTIMYKELQDIVEKTYTIICNLLDLTTSKITISHIDKMIDVQYKGIEDAINLMENI